MNLGKDIIGEKVAGIAAMLLTIGMLATGCAGAGPKSIANDVALIAPGEVLAMPAPGDLGRSVTATQLITVRRESETYVFEGNVSVTPERLQLVGVDTIGRRAMTILWDKSGRIDAETASWLPDAVKPGPMLADIVILYWPEDVVRRALPAGAVLIARPGARSVVLDGQEIFHAEYLEGGDAAWAGHLRYRNTSWGYEIEVQSVEVEP